MGRIRTDRPHRLNIIHRRREENPSPSKAVVVTHLPEVAPIQSSKQLWVHGSLARAGKVRGQTPKVAKQDKKKKPRGRAHKRLQHNRRFVTAVVGFGKKRGPNSSEK
ncbi:hypothetical protein Bca4012_087089 [Brassica carinata]